MARIKFKKKYPNLTESINEKLLDESMKDWIAKKLNLQRKPTQEELDAQEKALRDKYIKQAQEMIKKGSRTGMDLFNKIWLANMLMNNVSSAKGILKGFSNNIASTLDSKNIVSPAQAAERLNALNGQDAIKNFGYKILGGNLNWFKDPKNLKLLNWKQRLVVQGMLKDISDSNELSKSYDLLNNAKTYASALGNKVKGKISGIGDKIGSGAKDLWGKANELDPDILKHLGYAGGAVALAGGAYLAGKKLYNRYKNRKDGKKATTKVSENALPLFESFNLPNLKKSKSARVVFNTFIKSSKLSEEAILAAYLSTPIGVKYGITEGSKYFKAFRKDFKENAKRLRKVKKYLEDSLPKFNPQLPELPALDDSGLISGFQKNYNSVTQGMSPAELDAFNRVGEELTNSVNASSRRERVSKDLDPIIVPKIKDPTKPMGGMDYSKLALAVGPAAAAALIALAIKKYRDRKKKKRFLK